MKYTLFILILLFGVSCKTQTTKKEQPLARTIVFGSGGGFSGLVTEFKLEANGNLSKREYIPGKESPDDPGEKIIKELTSSETKALFDEADALKLGGLSIKEYGNMTNFLEITSGEQSHRADWVNNSNVAPKALIDLYTKLNSLTSINR